MPLGLHLTLAAHPHNPQKGSRSMDVVISLSVLFVLATVATIRWAGHNFGHALIAFLAGLFIATTAAGPAIRNAVESIVTAFAHLAQHH